MINIISGQTATISTPNNAPQKKEKTNLFAKNTTSNSSNIENAVSSSSIKERTAIFTSKQQEEGDNPNEVDYQKEALSKLIDDLQKEYIERNHYIDEDTQLSVLQIINTETDNVIGQYPSDLYLNLLAKVRETQKQLVNKRI